MEEREDRTQRACNKRSRGALLSNNTSREFIGAVGEHNAEKARPGGFEDISPIFFISPLVVLNN
jgi:hypothetical protein